MTTEEVLKNILKGGSINDQVHKLLDEGWKTKTALGVGATVGAHRLYKRYKKKSPEEKKKFKKRAVRVGSAAGIAAVLSKMRGRRRGRRRSDLHRNVRNKIKSIFKEWVGLNNILKLDELGKTQLRSRIDTVARKVIREAIPTPLKTLVSHITLRLIKQLMDSIELLIREIAIELRTGESVSDNQIADLLADITARDLLPDTRVSHLSDYSDLQFADIVARTISSGIPIGDSQMSNWLTHVLKIRVALGEFEAELLRRWPGWDYMDYLVRAAVGSVSDEEE